MPALRDHGRAIWLLASLAAAAALVGLTGCDLGPKDNVDKGQQLFTQKCGSCHTLTGAGTNGDIGPNLDYAFKQARANGFDSDTIKGVVEYQIAHARPGGHATDRRLHAAGSGHRPGPNDVASYVASVAGVPGIKPPVFAPPQFFATNCGGCHTLAQAGTTGTIGPNLDEALPGMTVAEISQSISNPNAKSPPATRRT